MAEKGREVVMETIIVWVLVFLSFETSAGETVTSSQAMRVYSSQSVCDAKSTEMSAQFPTDTYECQGVIFRGGE